MFDLIHKRRMAEPTRYFPEGKGPLHYKHVYELRCAEVLHHRNPRDGTAVVIIRLVVFCTSVFSFCLNRLQGVLYYCQIY